MTLTFPFCVEIDVRGYEIDSFGHVNNAVYLNWLELTRWEMSRVGGFGMAPDGVLPVVRHVELSFEAETRLGDRLRIITWPRRLGNTSFTMGQAIRIISADDPERVGRIALKATTVLACIVPGAGKAPVPEVWRQMFPADDPGAEPPAGV